MTLDKLLNKFPLLKLPVYDCCGSIFVKKYVVLILNILTVLSELNISLQPTCFTVHSFKNNDVFHLDTC